MGQVGMSFTQSPQTCSAVSLSVYPSVHLLPPSLLFSFLCESDERDGAAIKQTVTAERKGTDEGKM